METGTAVKSMGAVPEWVEAVVSVQDVVVVVEPAETVAETR